MQKKSVGCLLLILLICLLFLFSACSSIGSDTGKKEGDDEAKDKEETIEEFAGIKWEKEESCAIAFLGYFNTFQDEELEKVYEAHIDEYPGLVSISKISKVETESAEAYLIIPRYTDSKITINEYSFDENGMGETGKTIYSEFGSPVLLLCNFSDIMPNSIVTVKMGREKISFSPSISMKDGGIFLPDDGGQDGDKKTRRD